MNSINIGFFSSRGDIEDGEETITQIQMQAGIEQIFMKFPLRAGAQGLVEDAHKHTGNWRQGNSDHNKSKIGCL